MWPYIISHRRTAILPRGLRVAPMPTGQASQLLADRPLFPAWCPMLSSSNVWTLAQQLGSVSLENKPQSVPQGLGGMAAGLPSGVGLSTSRAFWASLGASLAGFSFWLFFSLAALLGGYTPLFALYLYDCLSRSATYVSSTICGL